jgi:hypothetical protein
MTDAPILTEPLQVALAPAGAPSRHRDGVAFAPPTGIALQPVARNVKPSVSTSRRHRARRW